MSEPMLFSAEIWYWRGPAPWFFVSVPEPHLSQVRALMRSVTYGWGMVPARVRIGGSDWETALWPKDGGYIVPIRASIRNAEKLVEGQVVQVDLQILG